MSEMGMDFSGLDAAISSTTTSEAVETPETTGAETTGAETTEVPSTEVEGKEHQEETPDELKTPEEKETEGKKSTEEKSATPTAKLRSALKAFRDADPENNKSIAAELNNMLGRQEAYQKLFPSVKEAQSFKTFVDNLGGMEGLQTLHETVENVNMSDQLLYAGNPDLIDNIVEDLKTEGKLDALGKLAPKFLDSLMQNDVAGYKAAFLPHFLNGLESAGVREAVNGLVEAFDNDNKEGMKKALIGLAGWYNSLLKQAGDAKAAPKVNPEQEAWQKEKQEFEQKKTKEFQTEVVSTSKKNTATEIVKAVAPFMKYAFFKDFPKESRDRLCNDIYEEINSRLQKDPDTQTQMKILWKKGDKDKLTSYWNGRVQGVSSEAARAVVKLRYPGAFKSAPKTTAAKAPATAIKVAASNSKPIKVTTQPKWEDLDFSKDPKQLNFIMGRGWLKNGRYISWR